MWCLCHFHMRLLTFICTILLTCVPFHLLTAFRKRRFPLRGSSSSPRSRPRQSSTSPAEQQPASTSPSPSPSTSRSPSPCSATASSRSSSRSSSPSPATPVAASSPHDSPSTSGASPFPLSSFYPSPFDSTTPTTGFISPASTPAAAEAAAPTAPDISLSVWLNQSSLPGYLREFRNFSPDFISLFIRRLVVMIQVIHFCIKAINFQLHPPTAYSNFISGVLQRPMDPLTAYLSHRKDELKPATILTRLDDFSTFSTWFCLHHLVQPSLLLPIKDSLYTLRRTYRRKNKALRSQRTMASEVVLFAVHLFLYYFTIGTSISI